MAAKRNEQLNGKNQGEHSPKSYGKKKKRYNYPRIALLLLCGILVIGVLVFGLRSCFGTKPVDQQGASFETEQEKFSRNVKINGTSIKGMSREEAKVAVLKDMNWSVTISYNQEEYVLGNIYEHRIDEILDTVYNQSEDLEEEVYELELEKVEDALAAEVAAVSGKWDLPARDSGISEYDPSTGKFLFSKEEAGLVIDQERLLEDLRSYLGAGSFQAVIHAEGVVSQPQLTEAQAREQYKIIGSFTTTTTANKDRNKNITLASQAINGKIVAKGEIFSINDATGERTPEKGYRPAGAYVKGVLVEEPGGGVCQVSSTLYNAVILAGLQTKERFSHTYVSSYVPAGEDAMINYPNLDMKFENTTSAPIGILASLNNQKLVISIYGIPVLEPGVTQVMDSSEKKETAVPDPTYVEDPTLPQGMEVVDNPGKPGLKVVTYLVTKKDGVEIGREFLHNSTYSGKAPVIRRNTDPNAPLPSESSVEGESPAGGETVNETAPNHTQATKPTAASSAETAPAASSAASTTQSAESTTQAPLSPGDLPTESVPEGPWAGE